jgi:hypothetical protein
MHFSTLTTSLISLFAIATASPLNTRQTTTTPPARYYLETKVVNGNHKDYGTNKTGLFLYSYHTGAGLGDAALSSNKSIAWEGYLNGTQQLFTTAGNNIGPWPLSVSFAQYTGMSEKTSTCSLLTPSAVWNPAMISIASQPSVGGFFFNSTGLQFNYTGAGTNGWLGTCISLLPMTFS